MANVHLDFRVTGNEDDVRSFTLLLATIGLLCSSGSSRRLVVDVDGDGSANLAFDALLPNGAERLTLPEGHAMREAVWSGREPLPTFSIGE